MPLTIKGAILVIVFVLSVAAYRVIERPARRWGRRLALAPRGDTILLRAPAGG